MDIRQLRYFSAIVRTGSFTHAAEELGITQPTLSQQIRTLEKQIGNPLFERLAAPCASQPMGGSASARRRHSATGRRSKVLARPPAGRSTRETSRWRNSDHHAVPDCTSGRSLFNRFPEVDLQFTEDTTPHLVEQLQSATLI